MQLNYVVYCIRNNQRAFIHCHNHTIVWIVYVYKCIHVNTMNSVQDWYLTGEISCCQLYLYKYMPNGPFKTFFKAIYPKGCVLLGFSRVLLAFARVLLGFARVLLGFARVLLGFARCVFIGSTVLEVIFSSFCEAILVLIIPKHRSHAFFFRGNLDIRASNQLLCVPTGSIPF